MTLVFTTVMAVVLVAVGLFLLLSFRADLDATIDQGLRSRADDVTALARQSDSGLRESAPSDEGEDKGAGGASFAQILTLEGQVFDSTDQLGGQPALDGPDLARAASGPIILEPSALPGIDGPVRVLARPVEAQGVDLVVVVGASIENRDNALSSLSGVLLIGGPIALILASLAGYGAAVGALRPVEAMRRRAAEISAAEPGQRLPVPEAHDELWRLGETLNATLGRLEDALERERSFVDDASHELRTPLTAHKAELELALRYAESPEELRAAIASAIEEADRLSELAENLLVIARSDKGRLAVNLEPVEVAELLGGLRERFAPRVVEAGRELLVESSDGLVVEADGLRLRQALANLVENALHHGAGPIRIWTRTGEGRVELHVSDSGAGFPVEYLPRAFERFSRADVARSDGGTGLGLAIVAAIARAHRGQASAANRPEGGADVWIELGLE